MSTDAGCRRRTTVAERRGVLAIERVAHAAAGRAGALLRARYRDRQEVSFKSEVNLVTAVDREAERVIVDAIRDAFPDHGIVAEESPALAGAGVYRWYVDPLDGTTNFAHGMPHFAVSIAVAESDRLVFALVHDPMRDETFSAVRGCGARLNGAPIRVSEVSILKRALVASGFPYDRRRHADFYLAFWREAMMRAQGVRRVGSAALDLCWVACGRFDAFWEWRLQAWDVAAGHLVVEEAGGRITDMAGGPHRLDGEETAASNGRLHPELLSMIADVRRRHVALEPRHGAAERLPAAQVDEESAV
jgi:myo-inositol-1(or 4)-monophosphatase